MNATAYCEDYERKNCYRTGPQTEIETKGSYQILLKDSEKSKKKNKLS